MISTARHRQENTNVGPSSPIGDWWESGSKHMPSARQSPIPPNFDMPATPPLTANDNSKAGSYGYNPVDSRSLSGDGVRGRVSSDQQAHQHNDFTQPMSPGNMHTSVPSQLDSAILGDSRVDSVSLGEGDEIMTSQKVRSEENHARTALDLSNSIRRKRAKNSTSKQDILSASRAFGSKLPPLKPYPVLSPTPRTANTPMSANWSPSPLPRILPGQGRHIPPTPRSNSIVTTTSASLPSSTMGMHPIHTIQVSHAVHSPHSGRHVKQSQPFKEHQNHPLQETQTGPFGDRKPGSAGGKGFPKHGHSLFSQSQQIAAGYSLSHQVPSSELPPNKYPSSPNPLESRASSQMTELEDEWQRIRMLRKQLSWEWKQVRLVREEVEHEWEHVNRLRRGYFTGFATDPEGERPHDSARHPEMRTDGKNECASYDNDSFRDERHVTTELHTEQAEVIQESRPYCSSQYARSAHFPSQGSPSLQTRHNYSTSARSDLSYDMLPPTSSVGADARSSSGIARLVFHERSTVPLVPQKRPVPDDEYPEDANLSNVVRTAAFSAPDVC